MNVIAFFVTEMGVCSRLKAAVIHEFVDNCRLFNKHKNCFTLRLEKVRGRLTMPPNCHKKGIRVVLPDC